MMKKIIPLLLVIVIAPVISCTKPLEKNIGLQLWSIRDAMNADVAGTIETVGEIGFSFVEAAGYSDGKFYGMEPLEFKNLLNKNGIEFLASHTGQALPDSTNWEEVMAWWDTSIDAHLAAGVKFIVQPFMDPKGYESIENLKLYCEYFNAVGEKCNAKGIQFGYHNHDKEFEEIDGFRRYDFMLQNTDADKVYFQLDLYWINKGGQNAVEYFNKYPGRFKSWHVKDEKELGESGTMDFETVFAASEISGMDHYIVEVERYNFEPLESVRLSYEYLMAADYVK